MPVRGTFDGKVLLIKIIFISNFVLISLEARLSPQGHPLEVDHADRAGDRG